MKDIENNSDIQLLVDEFYKKVNEDELLSPIFNEIAQVNWKDHLPKMYKFWSKLLLNRQISLNSLKYCVNFNSNTKR